jgi:diguanylate cyclase (GGDEF)-like protein/PAS domain S-box-containing protein
LDALAAAHAELSRRQSFTDALLETVEVGIVSCDADGVLVVSNRAERAMFGLQSGLEGLLPAQFAPRIDVLERGRRRLAPDEYPLIRTLRGDSVASVEMLVGPAGGPHREIVVRGRQTMIGPDGAVLGAVAVLTDVSAERAASRELVDERRKLVEAQRLGQLGSFEYDFADRTWSVSEQMCVLWGVEPEGFLPEMTRPLVVEEDLEVFSDSWRAASRTGGRHSYEYRIRRANDGAERVIRSVIEVELDPDGAPVRARGAHLDVTDLTLARHAAQRANAFFDAVLTATPDYTFVTDLASSSVIYGSRGKDILGITTAQLEALGTSAIATLIHPDDQQDVRAAYVEAAGLPDGELVQIRHRGLHADGGWRRLNRRVTPFRRDTDGRVVEVLVVLRDVTDVVQAEDRLTHAARYDDLTGLPNRTLLLDRLDAALIRSGHDGREVAVLFCDLDGFKRVNDTAGHAAGDAVLLETARRLSGVLRKDDTVARVGGDEFVMIVEPWSGGAQDEQSTNVLPAEPDRALAVRVARRVVEALGRPISVDGGEHLVTASIGTTYATLANAGSGSAVTADKVVHDADAAMYLAKDRGKNRFEIFERARREPPAVHPLAG